MTWIYCLVVTLINPYVDVVLAIIKTLVNICAVHQTISIPIIYHLIEEDGLKGYKMS